MTFSDKGLNFLKRREACKLKAYLDSAGIPTIGYGTIRYLDGTIVDIGDTISQEQADILLRVECAGILRRLEGLISIYIVQNELDALVSFCYNIGVGGFKTSTLLKKINSGSEIKLLY